MSTTDLPAYAQAIPRFDDLVLDLERWQVDKAGWERKVESLWALESQIPRSMADHYMTFANIEQEYRQLCDRINLIGDKLRPMMDTDPSLSSSLSAAQLRAAQHGERDLEDWPDWFRVEEHFSETTCLTARWVGIRHPSVSCPCAAGGMPKLELLRLRREVYKRKWPVKWEYEDEESEKTYLTKWGKGRIK